MKKTKTEVKQCKQFLKRNGWQYDPLNKSGSGTYYRLNSIEIEINEDEIVLIDETGDFLHLPVNYYALLGALLEFRQIHAGYISANNYSKHPS